MDSGVKTANYVLEMLPTRALVMAPVMMAKLGVVTVSVMQTSLVQHVRNVFLENLEVTVQVNANALMEFVMMVLMAMEDVSVTMVGKDLFAIPLQILTTAFQPIVVDMPHAADRVAVVDVTVILVTQAMEPTAQKLMHALSTMVAVIKMPHVLRI